MTEPGVITGDLQDAVRELGWYYPPDPASLRECSIGGNLATNAGGTAVFEVWGDQELRSRSRGGDGRWGGSSGGRALSQEQDRL